MINEQNKSPPRHTPGPWAAERHTHFYKVSDEQDVTVADIPIQPLDPPEWAEGNAGLIAAAPKLLDALERAFDILDRIADRLLYEEGQPVTFLESREIEEIYDDSISELAPFEALIREARGQQ
jgi:hypothetical protein